MNPTHMQEVHGLYFWARSGGGHRTAKDAVIEHTKKRELNDGRMLITQEVDITGDKILNQLWLPFLGKIGDAAVNAWDSAQKQGNIGFLKRYASFNWLGEFILYPFVYFRTKYLLQQLQIEPKYVVSTQAFCISAVVHAMQTVNREKKWNMHMNIYLTDMPSKHAIHFTRSIKKIGDIKEISSIFTLHAPKPILKPAVDEDRYWKNLCGKYINVITTDDFPIRQSFLDNDALHDKLKGNNVNISLKLNSMKEFERFHSGAITSAVNHSNAIITVKDSDKVSFLMLGSQPTTQSVLNWLDTFCEQEKAKQKIQDHYFFLYCGAPEKPDSPNQLLDEVNKKLAGTQVPEHLKIIPFTNQDADTIALLMARSDVTITRSGGATCMELLQLLEKSSIPKRPNRQTLIHSEAALPTEKQRNDIVKKLLKKGRFGHVTPDQMKHTAIEYHLRKEGIVLWEASNAKYLAAKIGAHIVNPESAKPYLA